MMKKLITKAMLIGMVLTPTLLLPYGGQTDRGTPAAERIKSWEEHKRMRDASVFRGMHWQELGPRFMGGRVETIDAIPGTGTIYVGFGAGNVQQRSQLAACA